MATKERLGLIPKGLQEAAAASSPVPAPPAQEEPVAEDPRLNDIVARHARAAYLEQLDYLLVSALQAAPPAPVAAKLTAALTILRDDLAKLAI